MDAWIEVHTKLREHPKTYALMKVLRIGKAQAVGHLVCLWLWAIDNAEDGDLTPFPVEAISGAAEWARKAQTFVDALVSCGWVDSDGKRRMLHDWDDFTWRYLDKQEVVREQTKRRVAAFRKRKKSCNDNASENSDVTECNALQALPCNECNAPTVPIPNHTIPYSSNNPAASTGEGVTPPPINPNFGKVLGRYEQVLGTFPSPIIREDVRTYLDGGMAPEVLSEAVDETARASPQKPAAYFQRIMQHWQREGVRDMAGLAALKQRDQPQQGIPRGGKPSMPDISDPASYRQQREEDLPEWARMPLPSPAASSQNSSKQASIAPNAGSL